MKKIFQLISFLGLVLVLGGAAADAQTFGKKFDAQVGFDFAIGDKVLPAGKYVLRIGGDPNGPAVLQVRNAEREIVFSGLILTNAERVYNSAELRFDRVSGRPALSMIVSGEAGYSIPLPSRATLVAGTDPEPTKANN